MPSSVRTIFRLLFCTLLLAVFWLALMPAPNIAKLVSWQDKIEHALAFATLALLAYAGWPRHPLRIAAGLLLYGAAMELAQSQTSHRFGDPWDWVADAVGLLVLVPLVMRGYADSARI
ncbi:MAG: VanZ family protein [Thauera sp.]|jgi:VanZ family protein|nr:VanZ family protein [Thauera sp.]